MLQIDHYAVNAASVTCGDTTIFFSYETIVAIRHGDLRYKTDQYYNATTSRHMNKMGVSQYAPLPDTIFNQLVNDLTIVSPNMTTILPENTHE